MVPALFGGSELEGGIGWAGGSCTVGSSRLFGGSGLSGDAGVAAGSDPIGGPGLEIGIG